MALVGQRGNLALECIATLIEKRFGFRAFLAAVFGQIRNVAIDLFAERLRQRLGIRVALIGQCANPAFKRVTTRLERSEERRVGKECRL